MENNTSPTRENLVKDISALQRDVTQIAEDLKAHAVAKVEATKQRIHEKVESARAAVSSRPLAILFVGFLIGFIIGSRRRN
jgi:ElaB/YqjD/DUF883 family membrane-anchored ribosome-binding protein